MRGRALPVYPSCGGVQSPPERENIEAALRVGCLMLPTKRCTVFSATGDG
jgi:hypothetical protein